MADVVTARAPVLFLTPRKGARAVTVLSQVVFNSTDALLVWAFFWCCCCWEVPEKKNLRPTHSGQMPCTQLLQDHLHTPHVIRFLALTLVGRLQGTHCPAHALKNLNCQIASDFTL